MISQTHRLDVVPGGVTTVVHVKQYQTDERLVFELFSRFGDFEISAAYTECTVRGTKADGNGYLANATCDPSNNSVTVQLTEQITAVAGLQPYELTVTDSTGRMITATFYLDVQRAALDADTIIADSEIRDLETMIQDLVDQYLADHPEITTTVQDGSITEAKLSSAVISAYKNSNWTIPNGTITEAMLSTAVQSAYKNSNFSISDGSITTSKLASNAVTSAKIGSGAVTAEKIGSGAVTTAKLGDDVKNHYSRDLLIKDLAGKAIAHRGFGWLPVVDGGYGLPGVAKHTIKAFQIAADNGFECIELDVQKDVNGVICCFHDSDVSADCVDADGNAVTGLFKNYNYTALRYKANHDEGVITFERACMWAAANDIILEVEIKTGTSYYNVVSIAEVLSIANGTNAKVFINCQDSSSLLSEMQTNYPNVWKNTNTYKQTTITTSVIDTLVSNGYSNLCLYLWPTTDCPADVVRYAYDRNILIIRNVYNYATYNDYRHGMTFSDRDRPNHSSPFVYDSGWIEPELENGYENASSNYILSYRRVGDMVTFRGILQNSTWTAIPVGDATLKKVCTLPEHFRPGYFFRSGQQVGDKFLGWHTVHIHATNGDVIPCFRVDSNLTVDNLNDYQHGYKYYMFFSFPVAPGT